MIEIKLTREYCTSHNSPCIFGELITDDRTKIREATNSYLPTGKVHISEFLVLFKKHSNLYEALKFPYNLNHHPGDADFGFGCDGFKTFVQEHYKIGLLDDIPDPSLEELANATTTYINTKLVEHNHTLVTRTEFSSRIHFPDPVAITPTPTPFTDPQFINNAILITDSGNYQLTLAKTTGDSLLDIEKSLSAILHGSYESQLNTKLASLNDQLNRLKSDLSTTKITSFTEGVNCSPQITNSNWKVEDGCLIYKKKIFAKQVKHKDLLYSLPPKTYFISGLTFPIGPTISKASCKSSHHPNVKDGSVCMGDLANEPLLEVLTKLPESLEIANMDSSFTNPAEHSILNDLRNNTLEQTSEIWTGDDW